MFGTHDYEKFGHYPLSVTIKGHRTKGAGTATAVIENAPRFLFFGDVYQSGGDVRVVQETDFTKVIASFVDLNPRSKPSDFDASIDWGDGSFSGGTLAYLSDGGPGAADFYLVSGMHKYLSEQTFTVSVSVREKASGEKLDQSGSVVSGDPPLVAKPGKFLNALEGLNTGDRILVKFERANGVQVPLDASPSEYTVTINSSSATETPCPSITPSRSSTACGPRPWAEPVSFSSPTWEADPRWPA